MSYFSNFLNTKDWLQTFPSSWTTRVEISSFSFAFCIKKCIVVHQTYLLGGRNYIDEEFLLVSPSGHILDNSPIYRRAKFIPSSYCYDFANSVCKISPWSAFDEELCDSSLKYFHAAKPNYGHVILDFMPEFCALYKTIKSSNGSFFVGSNPDPVLYESVRLLDNSSSSCLKTSPFPHKYSGRSYRIYLATNVILSPLNSRCDRITELFNTLLPAIPPIPSSHSVAKNIFINRTANSRVLLGPEAQKWLLYSNYVTYDLTKMNLIYTAWLISSASNIVMALGAETSNLIFASPMATSHILLSQHNLSSPHYLNIITDTIIPITNSNVFLHPLPSEAQDGQHQGMADSKIILNNCLV